MIMNAKKSVCDIKENSMLEHQSAHIYHIGKQRDENHTVSSSNLSDDAMMILTERNPKRGGPQSSSDSPDTSPPSKRKRVRKPSQNQKGSLVSCVQHVAPYDPIQINLTKKLRENQCKAVNVKEVAPYNAKRELEETTLRINSAMTKRHATEKQIFLEKGATKTFDNIHKCDICDMHDGYDAMNMQKCKTCDIYVHEKCYGLQQSQTQSEPIKYPNWECFACACKNLICLFFCTKTISFFFLF